MKSFNQWQVKQKFIEFSMDTAMPATPQDDIGGTARPDSIQGQSAMNTTVQNQTNSVSALGGQIGGYLSRALATLETKNVNVILQAQAAFNSEIQKILNEKSSGAARRGARMGLNQARNFYKNPTQQ